MNAALPWQRWTMLFVFMVVLLWSALNPKDYFTWVLEVLPALIGIIIIVATYARFELSNLAYLAILLHSIVLMVGGHYTYAEVPLFNWLRDAHIGLVRNDYDRVGHFAQGFFPAIVSREILLRRSPLGRGKWLFFIVTCICLSISAIYEIIEWRVAVSSGDESVAFLATQGDVWDTQWDMLAALIGTIVSLLLLSRAHDRSMEKLGLN